VLTSHGGHITAPQAAAAAAASGRAPLNAGAYRLCETATLTNLIDVSTFFSTARRDKPRFNVASGCRQPNCKIWSDMHVYIIIKSDCTPDRHVYR